LIEEKKGWVLRLWGCKVPPGFFLAEVILMEV